VTYLEAAHHAGLLHLELTPERILLAEEDKLLICGFSTDKLHYPPEDLTASHDYRAPELASFRGHLGKWTDYYSLGAILYQGRAGLILPTHLLDSMQWINKPRSPDFSQHSRERFFFRSNTVVNRKPSNAEARRSTPECRHTD